MINTILLAPQLSTFAVPGIKNVDVDHAASHLGKAIGLTSFIRSIPHNAQRRRVLVPEELLVKYRLSQEDWIRFTKKEKIQDVVFEIASQAHMHYKKVCYVCLICSNINIQHIIRNFI